MVRPTWRLARRLRPALALLVLLTTLGMPGARVARAADCLVTSTADSGAGTLRAAIDNTDGYAACTNISFQAGLGPITLETRIDIDHSVTIAGPDQVVRRNPALSAAANGGLLGISNGTVALSGLTIEGGRTDAAAGAGLAIGDGIVTLDGVTVRDNVAQDANGGGIAIDNGELHLTNTIVEDNRTVRSTNLIPTLNGGGIYVSNASALSITGGSRIADNQTSGYGGGVANFGAWLFTLTDSKVSGNKASTGGGIYTGGSALTLTDALIEGNEAEVTGGGIAHAIGTMTLTGSTVRGNTAGSQGGGIHLQGLNPSRTTVRDSTISGNTAHNPDGDPALGGGIYVEGSAPNLTVIDSTISGNVADNGGGAYIYAVPIGTAPSLVNITVSGNTATNDGGGLFVAGVATVRFATITGNSADSDADGVGSGGGLIQVGNLHTVGSSILVGNRRGVSTPDDCGSPIVSAGYNVAGPGCTANGTTDISFSGSAATVLEATLADNGGPTRTHALVAGSPARNRGDNATCNYLLPLGPALLDQRGVARNDGQCDIGAFESAMQALIVTTVGDGTVGRSPAGSGAGPFTYQAGTVVTLTAQPAAGKTFVGWTLNGTPAGWAPSATLTMEAARDVTATFAAAPAFGDLPGGAPYTGPVEQLAARGVINGCDSSATPPLFCPADPTLRAQMAALIVRAIPSWAAETWENPFSDPLDDAELWSRVATLGHYQVAQGYQAELCEGRGLAVPCFGPLDDVTYGQTILFIARAMVAKGYWVLQPDNRAIFPDQNGLAGADPATDRQTLDHRALVTYVFYAGAPPDVDAGPGVPFRRAGVDGGGWGDASSRGWFARALWLALDSYWGHDGTLPDGRPAGGLLP